MGKDRRATPRRRIAKEVMLSVERLGTQFCATRDISPEGVFVDTGEARLPRGAVVEMTIVLPGGAGDRLYHLSAKVLRVSAAGAALRFDGLGIDSYSAILGLVYPA